MQHTKPVGHTLDTSALISMQDKYIFLIYSDSEILRKNGSAADATVAGLFCVGVINTQSMGLGGGFLLTYYERSSGKAYTLNARESAPAAAHEDMYNGDGHLMEKGKQKF